MSKTICDDCQTDGEQFLKKDRDEPSAGVVDKLCWWGQNDDRQPEAAADGQCFGEGPHERKRSTTIFC